MADSIPSDALYSGRCGTCTWYVSAAGQLVVYPTNGVSGNLTAGNTMHMFVYDGTIHVAPPWAVEGSGASVKAESVKSATFRAGVTTERLSWFFHKCSNLTSVDWGGLTLDTNEVHDITWTFYGCTALDSVNLSILANADITNTSEAFANCTSLTYVDCSPLANSSLVDMGNMFDRCTSLESVNLSGIDTSDTESMFAMFANCSSLTSLDLSNFDTSSCETVQSMFVRTPLLSQITLGSSFTFESIYSFDDYGVYSEDEFFTNACSYIVESESQYSPKPARNVSNGIQVSTNKDFALLTTAQREGTWLRQLDDFFNVSAIRTNNGTADEDGTDITLTVRFATSAETTDRTLSVYIKQASASTYPSAPSAVVELEGDSGIESVTLQSVGDDAYDLRCELYDGTTTFLAFPSVASNIRLFTLDESGNAQVFGGMTVGTPSTEATYAGDYAFIAGRGSDVAGSLKWNGELAIPDSATIGGNESVAGRLTMQSLPVIVRGTDGYLYYDDGN